MKPTVSIVVATSSVSREIVSRVRKHVRLEEPLVVAVNGTRDTGPWLLDSQDTLLVVALDESSRSRVEKDRLDSEEGEGGGSRLRLRRSGEGPEAQRK